MVKALTGMIRTPGLTKKLKMRNGQSPIHYALLLQDHLLAAFIVKALLERGFAPNDLQIITKKGKDKLSKGGKK